MARTPAPGTRRRILEASAKLFGEQGVRAVGMQQVIDATGVGKSLLYREFASKDELIAAWLRESDAKWWEQAEEVTAPHPGDPARQILALMEFFHASVREPDFHGCIYYNTSSEFREPGHPGRQEAKLHLKGLRNWFRDKGVEARAEDPDALADTLMLIVGGTLANGEVLGETGPARMALATTELVLRQYAPNAVAAAAL